MNLTLHSEKLYDLAANGYCGLLMPKDVMEKAVKILHKNTLELRELFENNKANLRPSDWSMSSGHNPVYVKFFVEKDWQEKVAARIKLFKLEQPKAINECYVVEDYNDGQKIANYLKTNQLDNQASKD